MSVHAGKAVECATDCRGRGGGSPYGRGRSPYRRRDNRCLEPIRYDRARDPFGAAEPEVRHVIVVDDGSSDDTAARAAQCGAKKGRVIVEQLPSNLGPAAARNVALKISTAPWVAVLDGDASISARHDKRDLERLRDSDLGLTTNYKSIFHPERTSGAEEALFKCGLSRSVGCRDRGGQVPQIRATWIF